MFLLGSVHDGRKDRAFYNRRAVELMMLSPDPTTHKRIIGGVRNFDSAAWGEEKKKAVLAGN